MDDTGDDLAETYLDEDMTFELDLEFDTEGSQIDFLNDSEPDDFEFNVGYNDTEVNIIKDDQSEFCNASDGAELKLPNDDVSHQFHVCSEHYSALQQSGDLDRSPCDRGQSVSKLMEQDEDLVITQETIKLLKQFSPRKAVVEGHNHIKPEHIVNVEGWMREILDAMLNNTKQSDASYCRYMWYFLDANRRSDNGQLLFDFLMDHRVTDDIIKATFGAPRWDAGIKDGIPVIDYTETSNIENVLSVYDIEAKHDRRKMKRSTSWDKDAIYTGSALCGIRKPLEDTGGLAVGLRCRLPQHYRVWQMGLEGVKAARARKASSKATGSDNLVSRMHEASLQKGTHRNIRCLSKLLRCSAENPRAAMPIAYCGLLLETLWMIFKGDLSTRSVTLDNVKKIGGSEACKFALSIRPKDMPTPPWTGEDYMVPIKQSTRFGFSRWSKQEEEIFRKFLVAYYDKNPGEPLFAPEYRCLHEKVLLAGFDKSARDVYLRYFKHWRERLGFPTVRQWCTKVSRTTGDAQRALRVKTQSDYKRKYNASLNPDERAAITKRQLKSRKENDAQRAPEEVYRRNQEHLWTIGWSFASRHWDTMLRIDALEREGKYQP